MEETISLKEIFQIIKRKFLLIISFTIGAAVIAAIVSYFFLTPIYQSSTQFIVNQSNPEMQGQQYIDQNTIRTNVELINTYNVIIKSNAILSEVVDELELSYTAEELSGKIDVSSEQNSQVVTVSVKDPDPQLATEIANMTVHIFQERIPEIMNVDNVHILTEAETEPNPSPVEPKPLLNIAIATVLGIMIGVGLAFLLEYFDTTVRNEEDIEKKLGLTLLGTINTIEPEDIRTGLASATTPSKQRGKGIHHVQAQKNTLQ